MKTQTWLTIAGVALAIMAAIALAPAALAQGPDGGYGRGMRDQMGGPTHSLVAVAAEQLGMPQADLVAELRQGKTIAQVAADRQVALATIVDAFVAPRADHLAKLVASGQLTQAQADQQLATMKAHVTARLNAPWSPQGNGPGAGFIDQDGDGVCDHAGGGRMGGGPRGRWNR